MIYRIVMDNYDIYGLEDDTKLISPKVTIEVNRAGSLTFTLPPTHFMYDKVKILQSDVEVYEDNELIWFGRVLSEEMAFNKTKTITCEGAMAFFNDSIQPVMSYENVTRKEFLTGLIYQHNLQVTVNRTFHVGKVDLSDDVKIYEDTEYEKTIDVINQKCLDTEGGYFFFRKEPDGIYIDWLEDMPQRSSQFIQFGLNLTELKTKTDGAKIFTSVIPLGKEDESTGHRINIRSVTAGGEIYIDMEQDIGEDVPPVEKYGRILKVLEFDALTNPSEIMAAGQRWLRKQRREKTYDPFTIECGAAELSYIDPAYKAFKVGQIVPVVSGPHNIDMDLPLTKMDIDMSSAVKKIIVGTTDNDDLSDMY